MPDQIHSPASPLAEISLNKESSPRLIILSGPSGAGKSTWCSRLTQQAIDAELIVGGLISRAVFVDGVKVGIELVDQLSGECRRLAVRRSEARDGLKTEQWILDPAVLDWGNQQLLALSPCDIIILDELGPQELERGRGLQTALKLIESRRMAVIVAVVRPKLLSEARLRWPWAEVLALVGDRAVAGAG